MPDDKKDKNILILHSNNDQLFHKLAQWAYQTDSVILYNPSNTDFDGLGNLFAIVIDTDLIETTSIPNTISERVIPSELNYNLIERILDGLKPAKLDNVLKNG